MAAATLELLSPARDADIGIAAVNHGADAVYIGGPAFGARLNAANPLADIERLVKHAHRFNARVYVTLNTILRDDELEEARRMAWDAWNIGVDALIVQDMGLLQIDMPPLQLHASTQCDIRTPEKARFLQDAGFSKLILARELDLGQIRAVAAQVDRAMLEFFIHGALCVAYSGQCFISHAHTGRSANRGNCSQECRLPYTVIDSENRIVAHESHVLSLKDNDQTANLGALVDAGIRSFKIEGRYKDMGYVKNITAHYRRLIDGLLQQRGDLRRPSAGRCTHAFTPDVQRSFNRGATDYFVNGRQTDIGAFDSPKHAGLPLGEVLRVGADHLDLRLDDATAAVANGDGLTWYDLQRELHGLQVNVATALGAGCWRVQPNEAVAPLKDLRAGTAVMRNRDMAWDRLMQREDSAERRIDITLRLQDADDGLMLTARAEDGVRASAVVACDRQHPRDAERARATLRQQLAKLGGTPYRAGAVELATAEPWFVPASALNALRRDTIAALDAARAQALPRLARAKPVEPPVPYPEPALSYLANVHNHAALAFYRHHGVQVVDAAYESREEPGEVSLMITKHCVRWSMSLCPKQAKGVTGVQGTVRAEPMTLVSGGDRLTLRFDCKPCEMHVVGRMRRAIYNELQAEPLRFYRQRKAQSPA